MSWLPGVGWDVPVNAPGANNRAPVLYWTGRMFVTPEKWAATFGVRRDNSPEVEPEKQIERPVFGKRGKR